MARRGRDFWHVRKLLVREPGDLLVGHRPPGPNGPLYPGQGVAADANQEKSDSAIVAVKPSNKAGVQAAEAVEPRAGTNGNADPAKHAPDPETILRVTKALDRARQTNDRRFAVTHPR